MSYFDSPKNKALWNRELEELRLERERRAKTGYAPTRDAAVKSSDGDMRENPSRRLIDFEELLSGWKEN